MNSFRSMVTALTSRANHSQLGFVLIAVLTIAACSGGGGHGGKGPGSGSNGTVPEAWADFCTATFTEDTPIQEFGDVLFTARAGDQYLLADFRDSFGGRAELV